MNYIKNKIDEINFKRKYKIKKENNNYFIIFKNQKLGPYYYITNQKELYGDFDTRGINKIPKDFIEENCEIFIGNKNIFLGFTKRKNIKNEYINLIDIINIESKNHQRILISKINLIFNFKNNDKNFLFINYFLDEKNKSVILDIDNLKIINEYDDNIKDVKFNYFSKNNNFFKLKYISDDNKLEKKQLNKNFYFKVEKIDKDTYKKAYIDDNLFDFFAMQIQINKEELIFGLDNLEESNPWNYVITSRVKIVSIPSLLLIAYHKPKIGITLIILFYILINLKTKLKLKLVKYFFGFLFVIVFINLIITWNYDEFFTSIVMLFFLFGIFYITLYKIIKNKIKYFENNKIENITNHRKTLKIKDKLKNIDYKKLTHKSITYNMLLIMLIFGSIIGSNYLCAKYEIESVVGDFYRVFIIIINLLVIYATYKIFTFLSYKYTYIQNLIYFYLKIFNTIKNILELEDDIETRIIIKNLSYEKDMNIIEKIQNHVFYLKEKNDNYYKIVNTNGDIELLLF